MESVTNATTIKKTTTMEDSNSTDPLDDLKKNLNMFFLLTNAIFIIFMQAGFAFLECGSVRSKNSTNILIKNFMDLCCGGVAYWIFGYAFAYGPGNPFIGGDYFASYNLAEDQCAHWFFQYVFAATAASIVSGAVAERCDFVAYFVYSFFITGFIYPVITHWAWYQGGWLYNGDCAETNPARFVDFAGSGCVHLTGGIAALVAAVMLGPRIGRFDPHTGEPNDIRGHSVPLVMLGGLILVMGFFAFNGGSQGSITNPGDGVAVSHAVMNTIISGAFAGLVVLLLYRLGFGGPPKYWSLLMSLNGSLAGMVAICAGANAMRPWSACVTGSVAGVIFLCIHIILLKLQIDDPLDATSVHLGGGLWGLIAAPLFTMDGGIVYAADSRSGKVLGWNLLGAVAIIVWSGGLSFLMFGFLKLIKRLRVTEETELDGIDQKKHGEPSYPAESWVEKQYMNQNMILPVLRGGDTIKKDNQGLPTFMTQGGHLRSELGLHNRGFINEERQPQDRL